MQNRHCEITIETNIASIDNAVVTLIAAKNACFTIFTKQALKRNYGGPMSCGLPAHRIGCR